MELSDAKQLLTKASNMRGEKFEEGQLPKYLRFVSEDNGVDIATGVAIAILDDQMTRLDWDPRFGIGVFKEVFSWEEESSLAILDAASIWILLYYPALREVGELSQSNLRKGNIEAANTLLRTNFDTFEFY